MPPENEEPEPDDGTAELVKRYEEIQNYEVKCEDTDQDYWHCRNTDGDEFEDFHKWEKDDDW